MIRGLNIILSVLVVLLFAGLYHIRYAADTKISDIRQTQKAIQKAETRQSILQAEWISLNNPARLEALSEQHLGLRPLKAGQLHHARAYDFAPLPSVSNVSLEPVVQEVE
ncbi:MAG: cell division protein FtsL [Parvibaculales bacterium]